MKLKIPTLVFALGLSANAASIHADLLNYWALDGNGDDTAGSIANATSQTNNVATSNNASVVINNTGGLFGGAADFERTTATTGALAVTSDVEIAFDSSNITISLWAQFDDQSTNWQGLAGRGEGTNYRIARRNGTSSASAAFGGEDTAASTGTEDIDDGEWHHIAATGIAGGISSIYVDGVLVGVSGVDTIEFDPGANAHDNEFWIGNNPGADTRQWDGQIDDVGVWNRALSAAEIQEIFEAGENGIALGAIPEPSSTALLGLGGLAFILRRRR